MRYSLPRARQPLPLAQAVDAAISLATLHWLPDHAAVFRNGAAVLRPGGHLREMSSEDQRPFVHEVAQSLPEPVIDYVRLQISAIRA